MIVYLVLGGKEGGQGADIPTSLFTDSNANPLLVWITGELQDMLRTYDYDETYSEYEKLEYEDKQFSVIDFDKDGNLIFE